MRKCGAWRRALGSLAVAPLLSTGAQAANLVQNGGFENDTWPSPTDHSDPACFPPEAAIFGAASAHTAVGALIWISLALGGLAAAAPVAWTVPSLISPRESVGTLAGAVNLCGQIAAISAPIVTGYIVSETHSFASAFVTATVILLLGIVGYTFLLGRIEPIPEPEEKR